MESGKRKAQAKVPEKVRREYLALLQQRELLKKRRRLFDMYPDEGPLRRELYQPHTAFFDAGRWARERAVVAANGIGKTEGIGGYELVLHLTGLYPTWWKGKRFNSPIRAWAAGDTTQTVRDILQTKLVGSPGEEGTGLIPGDLLSPKDIKKKAGSVPDAIESVMVKHVSGGKSWLVFKSFDQGRRSFQGTEQHVIWLDEECPDTVYDECLMRTRTVGGVVLLTFTPINGLTQLVLGFMPNGLLPEDGKVSSSRFVVNATWEDAPHLTEKEKSEIISGTLPHLRDARSKGTPSIGSGVIYPISHADLEVEDFELPIWWPRVYGLDYGWNWTAALWSALDKENDIIYVYNAYKRGQVEPPIHAASILARGDWIPGVADPAKGTSQRDGKNLLAEYQELLGNVYPANNAREAGILAVFKRMTTGRLKIFKSVRTLFDELRLYRRDEHGNVVKENDHLCDDLRYIVMSGLDYAIEYPDEDYDDQQYYASGGRNKMTGY